tara:strand:+ start:21356 stop:21544 length:189 start_codon:yes stop_codon:yes gene_type:complete
MPVTRQYLVLHSGDRTLMKFNYWVEDIEAKTKYLNDALQDQLKYYSKDIKETASHIELELDL